MHFHGSGAEENNDISSILFVKLYLKTSNLSPIYLMGIYKVRVPVTMYDGCGSVAFVYWLRLK